MDTHAKLIAAQRLITVATGDPYGDGMIVTNAGVGYAEPGYHSDETPWVLGDWNDTDRYDPETQTRVKISNLPSRLFDALERIGVQGEWLDEWQQCDNCYRIVRTQGDSYFWKPFYVYLSDGDTLCGKCAVDPDFIDDVLAEYVNDSNRAVTWCDEQQLESLGWTRYNRDEYRNGWHEGMDDNPQTIAGRIKDTMPHHDYLFCLDESSQFYIGFSAFTRPIQCDHDDNDWADDGSNTIVCADCGATRNPSLGPDGTDWTSSNLTPDDDDDEIEE